MFKRKRHRARDCRRNDEVLVTFRIRRNRRSAFSGLVATIFYNLTDFTSNSQRSRGSSIFLNVPMNINTKAAVIYAAEKPAGRKEKGSGGRFDTSGLILCRGQCLCPRF